MKHFYDEIKMVTEWAGPFSEFWSPALRFFYGRDLWVIQWLISKITMKNLSIHRRWNGNKLDSGLPGQYFSKRKERKVEKVKGNKIIDETGEKINQANIYAWKVILSWKLTRSQGCIQKMERFAKIVIS